MALRFHSDLLRGQIENDERLYEAYTELTREYIGAVYVQTRNGRDPLNDLITTENVEGFQLVEAEAERALSALEARGLRLLYKGRYAWIVTGEIERYEGFGFDFVVQSRGETDKPMPSDLVVRPEAGDAPLSFAAFDDLPGVRLVPEERAALHHHPPPKLVDGQLTIEEMCGVLKVPAGGGTGIRFGMIDTAFEVTNAALPPNLSHEFVKPTSKSPTTLDKDGHGTAMLAIASAIAPRAHFVLASKRPCEYAALEEIVKHNLHVLSCSWGWPEADAQKHPKERAVILEAVRDGVTVLFSAGNSGMQGWPAAMPHVIAVGGVHVLKGKRKPSLLTSSFVSTAEPGRGVPDLCGLSGREADPPYVLVPVPHGSNCDRGVSGADDDGWAFSSHSSGATAQVAAVAALVREKNPGITPADVKNVLIKTAICVPPTAGSEAEKKLLKLTGAGLVDVEAALADPAAKILARPTVPCP